MSPEWRESQGNEVSLIAVFRRRWIAAILVVILMAPLIHLATAHFCKRVYHRTARGDIREAVFRYLIKRSLNYYGGEHARVSFLLIENNKDLSPDFLRRFTGTTPLVKGRADMDPDRPYVDPATGFGATIVTIYRHGWCSSGDAVVVGGFQTGFSSGLGLRLRCTHIHGRWRVVNEDFLWIS